MKNLKFLALGLLLILMPIMFVGCGKDVDGTFPGLSANLELQIRKDYLSEFSYVSELDNVIIYEYYGTYNESVVLIINGNGMYTQAIEEETVAERVFIYSNAGVRIKVWHQDKFYSLKEAHENEFLTTDNIETIYLLYYGN